MGEAGERRGPYTRLSTETRFTCPWWQMRHDRYRLPNGEVTDYFYVKTGGSTMVVPVAADGRLVLVRQHRYLVDRSSLEFPAGGVPVGGDPEPNAVKELREETGLAAGSLTRVGGFAPYNGVADEICHVYVARDLASVGAEPEVTESIEIEHRRVAELDAMIASGELWDGMTIAALTLARPHLVRSQMR